MPFQRVLFKLFAAHDLYAGPTLLLLQIVGRDSLGLLALISWNGNGTGARELGHTALSSKLAGKAHQFALPIF